MPLYAGASLFCVKISRCEIWSEVVFVTEKLALSRTGSETRLQEATWKNFTITFYLYVDRAEVVRSNLITFLVFFL